MKLGQVFGDVPGTISRDAVDKPEERPGAGGKTHFAWVNTGAVAANADQLSQNAIRSSWRSLRLAAKQS
ncbi:hypothetical protein WLY71_11710 [Pseudomonas sp. P2663]